MPLKELAERRNILHRKSGAETILKHVLDDVQIGRVAMVSSFGAESVVLLHMVSQIAPDTPILFLDTEMLFPETLTYQREVAYILGLTDVRVIRPSRAKLLESDVDSILHTIDPDACCSLRKTQPLEEALAEFDGWITGRKRAHGGARAQLPLYEKQDRKIKVNPLASWDTAQIANYLDKHDLPRHPLVARGFTSIGCTPCTTKVAAGEDPRAGRWRGMEKSECGIHIVDGKVIRRENAA
ncbi:phosphoadenylylsulfate reductase (thioredoxin) [Litoreibacter halocynthiae]|uniref:Adenosine 5'-phosphosulfate reductase n=1 Tax=Litoreibacter halocynthiae TaxID=1242689 RepID=A0A4R7LRB7_9RHOB|nr:phosphoadenylyl-sulfate reductase [Litoreibacter halocynthiae]TDT77536.1 phosphoadenylylsulfate reductase (thioredoxin) [Litoreibacter halocynthiae]